MTDARTFANEIMENKVRSVTTAEAGPVVAGFDLPVASVEPVKDEYPFAQLLL